MKYFFLLLLFSFLCLGDLSAQVGINNPNPSQALDVSGKIKVGDDQIAPVAGTIRYNRVSKTFEGYDGTEWSVFNPDSEDDSVVPSGSVIMATIDFNGSLALYTPWDVVPNGGSFNYVPAGRTLFITSIILRPKAGNNNSVRFQPVNSPAGDPIPGTAIDLSYESGGPVTQLFDPNGHLMVIPSGGGLGLSSQGNVIVYLRGFLL